MHPLRLKPFKSPQFLELIFKRTKTCHQKDLAEKLGVHPSNLSRILRGKERIPEKFLAKLRELPKPFTEEDVQEFFEIDYSLPRMARSRALQSAMPNPKAYARDIDLLPDLKSVLYDVKLGNQLLNGDVAPNLKSIVEGSLERLYLTNEQKELEKIGGKPTHFVQISCTLLFSWEGSGTPHALLYNRTPRTALSTKYNNVQGFSHLWGASWQVPTHQCPDCPMGQWISEIAILPEEQAVENFICGESAYLRSCLSYKVPLQNLPDLDFSPTAVITNDMRPDKSRIYTQYWFVGHTMLEEPVNDFRTFAKKHGFDDFNIDLVPVTRKEGERFVDPVSKKPLRMDALAWRYLCGETNLEFPFASATERIGRARLIPSFKLIRSL